MTSNASAPNSHNSPTANKPAASVHSNKTTRRAPLTVRLITLLQRELFFVICLHCRNLIYSSRALLKKDEGTHFGSVLRNIKQEAQS